jgi:hypothetical protein
MKYERAYYVPETTPSIKKELLIFGVAIVPVLDLQMAGTESGDVHRCMTPSALLSNEFSP